MKKKSSFWVLVISIVIIVVISTVAVIFYNTGLRNRLVIENQTLGITLNIKKLDLKKNGFLILTYPSGTPLLSQYVPAGKYMDFDAPYSPFVLPDIDLGSSYVIRGYVYEDTNGNQVLDLNTDHLLNYAFGRPVITKFNLQNNAVAPLSCSEGFVENFNGEAVNKNIWSSYIGNKLESGVLAQSSVNYSTENMRSTILYSKKNYSGDLQVDVDINSFEIENAEPGYSASSEISLFTPSDRVVSLKWYKSSTESYLTPSVGKLLDQPIEKFDVVSPGPLKVRIVRTGSIATFFLIGVDGIPQKLWEIPNISTDNVYLGYETYGVGPSSIQVSTTILDNFSVSCPSNISI